MKARNFLAWNIKSDSALYGLYLVHLLESVVSKGDAQNHGHVHYTEFEMAAKEVGQLIPPLAILASRTDLAHDTFVEEDILALARDAWFNIVVHAYTAASEPDTRYGRELKALAVHLRPLVTDNGLDPLESDIELNTVLRRGMTNERTAEHKRALSSLLPSCESDIKGLNYPRLIFLRATYLMETSRAESGDCAKVLHYFVNATLAMGPTGRCMEAICEVVANIYIRRSLDGTDQRFSASSMAKQLATIFVRCCHRVEDVQCMALSAADRIIKATPSALCQRSSLFALLELLSLMWRGCLDEEKDEYQWTSSFTSSKTGITLELSDDYKLRRSTLNALYKRAKDWVMRVINVAPLNVKGLLQVII